MRFRPSSRALEVFPRNAFSPTDTNSRAVAVRNCRTNRSESIRSSEAATGKRTATFSARATLSARDSQPARDSKQVRRAKAGREISNRAGRGYSGQELDCVKGG